MKTLIKKSVLALFLALGLNMTAKENFDVVVKDNFMVTVAFDSTTADSKLKLEDRNGEILFSEVLGAKPSFKKSLSMEALPQGTYYIVLENSYRVVTTTIEKDNKGLVVVEDNDNVIFKPGYKVEGNVVLVSVTNPTQKEALLHVYDTNGNVIGSVKDAALVVKQTLDFSKVPAGDYLISVKIGKETFNKTITIG